MRWIYLAGLVGVFLCPSISHAIWGVEDTVEYGPITMAEMVAQGASAASTVKNTLDSLSELKASADWLEQLNYKLGSWSLAREYIDELNTLAALVEKADETMRDGDALSHQWTNLFGMERVPLTSKAYDKKRREINSYRAMASSYASSTQTLINNTIRTVRSLIEMLDMLGELLGVTQTTAMTAQLIQQLNQLTMQKGVMQAATSRLQAIDAAADSSREESWRAINSKLMEDHPR